MAKNKYPYKALGSQSSYLKHLLSSNGFTKQLKSGRESLVTPTYRAYCYIFHEYTSRYKVLKENQNGWLQLVMDDLNTRFEGWDSRRLEEAGLLDIRRTAKKGRYSFKYRIPEHILDGWNASYDETFEFYNYFSGEPWTETDEVELWSETEKKWESCPARMKQAAEIFQESYFNFSEVGRHLNRLRRQLSKIPRKHPLYKAKSGELLNDELCFSALLSMSPQPWNYRSPDSPQDEYLTFRPRYNPATTGRIHMVGGALQSCTREMKYAAYGSLKEMRNYDLSSSQARILYHQEFAKYDIECPWLAEYLSSKEVRRGYADYIGVEDKVWKECFSALIMGAELPESVKNTKNAIMGILRKEYSGDRRELGGVLARLGETIQPLLPALEQWHSKLMEEVQKTGTLYNAMSLPIELSKLRGKKPYTKIAAHILQGTEAYFIQELTLLAPKFGYQPIANEHDGLVVIGEIPAMAKQEARSVTGLGFMELEPKNTFGAASY